MTMKHGEFGTARKTYMQGLVVASCNYDIVRGGGYKLYISGVQVGEKFDSVDDAEKVADDYVNVRVLRYVKTFEDRM